MPGAPEPSAAVPGAPEPSEVLPGAPEPSAAGAATPDSELPAGDELPFESRALRFAAEVLVAWAALVALALFPALGVTWLLGLPIPPAQWVFGVPDTNAIGWLIGVTCSFASGAIGAALARRSLLLALAAAVVGAALAAQTAHVSMAMANMLELRPYPPSWLWPMGGFILLGELLLFGPIMAGRTLGASPRAQALGASLGMLALALGPVRFVCETWEHQPLLPALRQELHPAMRSWGVWLIALGGCAPFALAVADARRLPRPGPTLRRAVRRPTIRRALRQTRARLRLAADRRAWPSTGAIALGGALLLFSIVLLERLGDAERFGMPLFELMEAPKRMVTPGGLLAATTASLGSILGVIVIAVSARSPVGRQRGLHALGLLVVGLAAALASSPTPWVCAPFVLGPLLAARLVSLRVAVAALIALRLLA